jgi:hypothetical protein
VKELPLVAKERLELEGIEGFTGVVVSNHRVAKAREWECLSRYVESCHKVAVRGEWMWLLRVAVCCPRI